MFALAPVTAVTQTLNARGIVRRFQGAMKGLSSFADRLEGDQSGECRASTSDTVTEALRWYRGGETTGK